MPRGLWRCLRRYPKPRIVTITCVVILVGVLQRSTDSLFERHFMVTFSHTGSSSQQSFEVVLCPMPRIHTGRTIYKGQYIPAFLHRAFFKERLVPFMTHPRGSGENPEILSVALNVTRCLISEKRTLRYTDSLEMYPGKFFEPGSGRPCWAAASANIFVENRAIGSMTYLIYTTLSDLMTQFLYEHYETLDERMLEEYEKLFDNAWVLGYENITLLEWLNFVRVDFIRHVDERGLNNSFSDFTTPLQQIQQSVISTRFAPQCIREVLNKSDTAGFQPSRIIFPFLDTCPKSASNLFGTWPEGTMCLPPEAMYVSVYITALNSFTDVPRAAGMVPFRVPLNERIRVHVTASQQLHEENCIKYSSDESQITCLEDCFFYQVLTGVPCLVPWLERFVTRWSQADFDSQGVNITNITDCKTKDELKETLSTIRDVFDQNSSDACHKRCPEDCRETKISARVTGIIQLMENDTKVGEAGQLELVLVDDMPVYVEQDIYSSRQYACEVMGSISFFIGVSLVALYDWLLGASLWIMRKLPFIPALPPVIKSEIYTEEFSCRCPDDVEAARERRNSTRQRHEEAVEKDDASDSDDGEAYLRKQFTQQRKRRRSAVIPDILPSFQDVIPQPRTLDTRRQGIGTVKSSEIASMLKDMHEKAESQQAKEEEPQESSQKNETTAEELLSVYGLSVPAKNTMEQLEQQVNEQIGLKSKKKEVAAVSPSPEPEQTDEPRPSNPDTATVTSATPQKAPMFPNIEHFKPVGNITNAITKVMGALNPESEPVEDPEPKEEVKLEANKSRYKAKPNSLKVNGSMSELPEN